MKIKNYILIDNNNMLYTNKHDRTVDAPENDENLIYGKYTKYLMTKNEAIELVNNIDNVKIKEISIKILAGAKIKDNEEAVKYIKKENEKLEKIKSKIHELCRVNSIRNDMWINERIIDDIEKENKELREILK